MSAARIDRRDFLKASGFAIAGLLIGFRVADAETVEAIVADFAPNAYLRIGTDGVVTLFADHVELDLVSRSHVELRRFGRGKKSRRGAEKFLRKPLSC